MLSIKSAYLAGFNPAAKSRPQGNYNFSHFLKLKVLKNVKKNAGFLLSRYTTIKINKNELLLKIFSYFNSR
jgi:hypothetical protein